MDYTPKVSVIVRSFNRFLALNELLDSLLNQNYENYEIIVIEQSTNLTKNEKNELLDVASHEKLHIFFYEPLGGAKARNKGVGHSSGEILIFIDDDDIPLNEYWIRDHVLHYQEEQLIGLTGRQFFNKKTDCPYIYWMRWYIRRTCMRYNWLKFPYTFAQFDEDITNVEWLHGTNSSIRREWVFKTGLWDTHIRNQDEHSFAFKLQPFLKQGYRLDFKKSPTIIRRMDIDGGMGKRTFSFKREFQNQFQYLSKIVYKYYPLYIILFPFHLLWVTGKSLKSLLAR